MAKIDARDNKPNFRWLKMLTDRSIFWWLLAAVIYSVLTILVMGDSITSCSTVIFGYPGDGTGGLAWFQWADGGGPIWGFTNLSNYPFGEQLNRPSFITAYGLYVPYSLFAMLTNQICGLNIMTALGFMSTALLMFGMTRWLTKMNGVAIFAGLAAAFVPFHQLQAQGHLSYLYSSIFVAIIWAFLWFMRKPNLPRMLLIVVLYVSSLYTDGYFILLSSALIAVLFVIFLFSKVLIFKGGSKPGVRVDFPRLWENIKKNYKIVIISILGIGILLVPIAYKQIKQGDEIQGSLSNARSNIYDEATVYGTHLEDFFLPSIRSVFVDDDYVNWRVANIHGSNQQENTLYIGYVVFALMMFTVVIAFCGKRIRKKWDIDKYDLAIKTSAIVIVVLTLFALPPYISIGKIDLATPTLLLIEVTEKWRVLARFFMITHVAMVLLASIGLALILNKMRSKWKLAVLLGVIVITAIEFYPVGNLNWSYERHNPEVYHKMADDKSIKAVAEYPITDHPSPTLPYTFTFQQTHQKPMLNANNSNTNQRQLRQSIAGLADVQTMGVLNALKIDTVTTLGINASSVNGLTQYMAPAKIIDPAIEYVYSYKVTTESYRPYALVAQDGFSVQLSKDKLKSSLYMINSAIMQINSVGLNTSEQGKRFKVSFTANAHEDGAQKLEIKQHDRVVWSGVVQTGTRVEFEADNSDVLRLTVPGYYNTPALYIQDLSTEERQ